MYSVCFDMYVYQVGLLMTPSFVEELLKMNPLLSPDQAQVSI